MANNSPEGLKNNEFSSFPLAQELIASLKYGIEVRKSRQAERRIQREMLGIREQNMPGSPLLAEGIRSGFCYYVKELLVEMNDPQKRKQFLLNTEVESIDVSWRGSLMRVTPEAVVRSVGRYLAEKSAIQGGTTTVTRPKGSVEVDNNKIPPLIFADVEERLKEGVKNAKPGEETKVQVSPHLWISIKIKKSDASDSEVWLRAYLPEEFVKEKDALLLAQETARQEQRSAERISRLNKQLSPDEIELILREMVVFKEAVIDGSQLGITDSLASEKEVRVLMDALADTNGYTKDETLNILHEKERRWHIIFSPQTNGSFKVIFHLTMEYLNARELAARNDMEDLERVLTE